jgi:hypothetical protein
VLAKGTTIEMILDRQVTFDETDLDFSNALPRRSSASDTGGPLPSHKTRQPNPNRIPAF